MLFLCSSHTSPDFPCALDVDAIPGLNRNTCDSTYAFRHRLRFTSNATEFEVNKKVGETKGVRVRGREGWREGKREGGREKIGEDVCVVLLSPSHSTSCVLTPNRLR